ncbi:MAG: hypothetical protein K0Q95_891 [Bacteroidota bacterium]|jgi:hypothetical protein|nr:hypothetical protein [Bacteroidota bacterium]
MNKKYLLLFLWGISFLLNSKTVANNFKNPSRVAVKDELIIQVPLASEKTNTLIKQAFLSYSGVTWVGKCNEQKLFFITVDRSLQQSNEFLEQTFRTLSLDYEIKIGTSIEKAKNDCLTSNQSAAAPEQADVD